LCQILPFREAYKTQANTLKGQGLNFPQIYKKLGTPVFDGQPWRLEMDKGKIKRKRQSVRQANRAKYNNLRQQRDVTKTEAEGRAFKQTQREAATDSDNLIHQIAYEGKPTVAEHDVALQAGGSKEYHSKSDPLFKEFKDNVERYTYANKPHYVVDIDNVSGGVRLILRKTHNKFEPTSQQPGRTIEQYEDYKPIIDAMPIVTRDRQLEQTLKGTPQKTPDLPTQIPPMTAPQGVDAQLGGFDTNVQLPEKQPEPKPDPSLAPQVMSAKTNGNGNGNGAYETNSNGNGGTYLNGNGNGNYAESIAQSAQLFGQITTTAIGAIGLTLLKQIDPTRALN